MRKIILIVISLMIAVVNPIFATEEEFYIYPALGTFSNDQKFLNYIKKHQEVHTYNNKLVYAPSFKLLENKYLIIKAIALGQMNNEQFLNEINNVDELYKKFDSVLKAFSIEENIKKIFRSSAILGFTTDTIGIINNGEKFNLAGFVANALKQVLEDEYIKSLLIKEVPYITELNYDIYSTIILSGVEFTLALLEDTSFKAISTKKEFISVFSKSFSKFVGVPLALYETGLKSVNIGATIGAIFSLNNAKNLAMPNRLASSFLYDYVNLFHGDINAMSNYIQNNYKYWNVGNATIKGDIRIYTKTSKWGQRIKNYSFFDVFYWYTLISEHNNKNLEIATFKREDLANIVRGARKALDYIEDYGNGGNFKCSAKYKIGLIKNKYPYKYLNLKLENSFNQLYFMYKTFDNNSRKIDKKFYNYTHLPQLVLPRKITYEVRLNDKNINNNNANIKIIKNNIENGKAYIYKKLSPTIKINYDNTTEVKKIQDFYISYGYFTGMNPENISYGQKIFSQIYNKGYLNTFDKRFNPKEPANTNLFVNILYGYIDGLSSKTLWNKCQAEDSCKNNIKYKLDYLTRDTLAKIIVKKYNLNKYLKNYGTLRPFKRKGKDWTVEGKTLYKLKIMSGDSLTERMNTNSYVSKIELLVIMRRLKNLISAKGRK